MKINISSKFIQKDTEYKPVDYHYYHTSSAFDGRQSIGRIISQMMTDVQLDPSKGPVKIEVWINEK